MKAPHFFITSAIGALCLILTIAAIVIGKTNNGLMQTQQQQQQEINRGNMSIQVMQNMLRDMAEISLHNPKIKDVLAKSGFTVNVAPSPSPASNSTPGNTPAPTATPVATPAK